MALGSEDIAGGAGATGAFDLEKDAIGISELPSLDDRAAAAFVKLKDSGANAFLRNNALRDLEQCAAEGLIRVAVNLGSIHFYGNFGVRVNHVKGARYWAQAAEAGDDFGLYNLGICYIQGFGVGKDKKRGVALLEAAANKSYPKAAYNLAYYYRLGDEEAEVERDIAKALWLYYRAITLPPVVDPLGTVAEEALVNFRFAVRELRTELALGASISDRIEAIKEGMATARTGTFTPDFFRKASEGDTKAFGILEGMFATSISAFMEITPFLDGLDKLAMRREVRKAASGAYSAT